MHQKPEFVGMPCQSTEEGNDQESIQLSTIPDWESDKNTRNTTQESQVILV